MSKSNSSGANRTRNFACIVYPESAPSDWLDILSSQCIPCFVSPLHDKDINPGGEPKKPHYHVILMFDSVKTDEQAKEVFCNIGGVGCERVKSIRGYARYLCHLDNPEKAQYSQEDIKSFGGADYINVIQLSSDKYVAFNEMIDFCEQYNIVSFYQLAKYARNNRSDWHRILCDCGTTYMMSYLKAKHWTIQNSIENPIDLATGEILDI